MEYKKLIASNKETILSIAPSSYSFVNGRGCAMLDADMSLEADFTIHNSGISQHVDADKVMDLHQQIKTECIDTEQNNDNIYCEIDIKEEELGIILEDPDIIRKVLHEEAMNSKDRANVRIGKIIYKT